MSNNKLVNDSLNSTTEIGMNLQELIKQGLEIIQTLCGKSEQWTNYNVSDPGITILEHLCYAITDLSYRLSFPVQDLLAEDANVQATKTKKKILFSAKEILPTAPLTINDYRKLLIDIPGVKNAWLKIANNPVYGLYQVFVEISIPYSTIVVIDAVRKKLHEHRNLCEDFNEIIPLEPREIIIEADIALHNNSNIITLKEKLYSTVEQILSPTIPFYSLEELIVQGKSIEEIYDGPILNNGFINDVDLAEFTESTIIYVADIIEALHKIPQVKIVRKLLIDNQSDVIEKSILSAFVIKEFKVNFYKNDFLYLSDIIQSPIYNVQQQKKTDWILPAGRYRDLLTYNSLQEDFPHNYLLGFNNIPNKETSSLKKVSSKQLKAYLLIFDQIFANYFADVNSIKTSFNYVEDLLELDESSKPKATYSSQLVNCSEIELLVDAEYSDIYGQKKVYSEKLEEITNEGSENNRYIRKNRLLDFLLALFGETYKDYSVASVPNNTDKLSSEQKLINKKIAYLTNLPKLNGLRGKAINYTLIDDRSTATDKTYNLQKSICNILGLSENEICLIEQILLRPLTQKHQDLNLLINKNFEIYSGQISIVLPKSKVKKVFNDSLEEKLNEVSRNEVPAHITMYYHMLDDDKIIKFKEFYNDWFNMLTSSNTNLDTLSMNSLIIVKILYCIKGIGSMVIGDEGANAKNYYYFTVFNGADPFIAKN